jgi:hypothetical protein
MPASHGRIILHQQIAFERDSALYARPRQKQRAVLIAMQMRPKREQLRSPAALERPLHSAQPSGGSDLRPGRPEGNIILVESVANSPIR